jgi:hypothetical protein
LALLVPVLGTKNSQYPLQFTAGNFAATRSKLFVLFCYIEGEREKEREREREREGERETERERERERGHKSKHWTRTALQSPGIGIYPVEEGIYFNPPTHSGS